MQIIARLDVKNEHVIKGIHLEGLRKVGDPNQLALKYYEAEIDEIIFMDAVASFYDQNNLFNIIEKACEEVFVPITIGVGLRSVDDVVRAMDSGADKAVINTGAVRDIHLVEQIANRFGSQCLIGSIEAKYRTDSWIAYVDNGREPTNLDAVNWAHSLESAGVGEILVTSIDKEGTGRGFDIELVEQLQDKTRRPIIVSGGYGSPKHIEDLLSCVTPSAVAFASVLHYQRETVADLRSTISLKLAGNVG